MNEHVSGETLAAYIDNRLEKGQRPGVEAHLSRCRECRQALADVAAMLADREKPPAEFLRRGLQASGAWDAELPEARERRPLFLRPAFGVAAVFLVAVVAGFFFLGRERADLSRPVEREMAGQPAAKGEAAEPARAEAAPPIAAAPEMAAEDRSGAAGPGRGGGTELKKKLAAEAPGRVPPASPLPEAAPAVALAERELPPQAGKAEPARYSEMEEGVIKEVPGGVEAQAERDRGEEMKAVFADKALPRPAGSGASVAMATRSRPAAGLQAASGALQILLATSGRAAAPPDLGIVELAAGPLVRIEGDVSGDDLLAPGLQHVREWLPPGSALQVTIGADGRVIAVDLLGEWESGAAVRAKRAAGKLVFTPARLEARRAILSLDLLAR